MNIKMVEFTPDYVISEDGNYLVRTESSTKLPISRQPSFFTARCKRLLKKDKYITTVDVNNQIVTHISEFPLSQL